MRGMRLLPRGIADFARIRTEGFYYVDKTMYLEKLERAGSFLFFIRPRRFGKSLFLSMLRSYYDVAQKNQFDALFGDLYVGKHPTGKQSSYQVLFFDFSKASGGSGPLQENLAAYCVRIIAEFARTYEHYWYPGFAEDVSRKPDAASRLNFITGMRTRYRIQLYLIIDEYDNFTNDLLGQRDTDSYHMLTHTGFYRNFFKLFKGSFERILMLGVSPVTLDDLTSGYNIATNISLEPWFNMMLGFSESDLRDMISYYQDYGAIDRPTDELIAEMKPWYDGYCFSAEQYGIDPPMYNSDMVLYYLDSLVTLHHPPKTMVDPNTKTDYDKLKKLVDLDGMREEQKKVFDTLLDEGSLLGDIVDQYPAEKLADPDLFVSQLYYLGMVTIVGVKATGVLLGVPNLNVMYQYFGYVRDLFQKGTETRLDLSRIKALFDALAEQGDWKPMVEFLSEGWHKTLSVHSSLQAERNVQGYFAAYLSMNNAWMTFQETELNKGYCDIIMMPQNNLVRHGYILELKYRGASMSTAEADKEWVSAKEQILRYRSDSRVGKMMGKVELHLLCVQLDGKGIVRMEDVG